MIRTGLYFLGMTAWAVTIARFIIRLAKPAAGSLLLDAIYLMGTARRTRYSILLIADFIAGAAVAAVKLAVLGGILTAADADGFAFGQRLRHLFTGAVQYILKGLPGNLHPGGAFILIQILQILQPHGFQFFNLEVNLLLCLTAAARAA